MTQEEKAKAFDEALTRARTWYDNPYMTDKAILEKIFPSLRDSEDERIRKTILFSLDRVFVNNSTIYEVSREQCLDWLERQKPQSQWKPTLEQMKVLYEAVHGYILQAGDVNVLRELYDELKELQDE